MTLMQEHTRMQNAAIGYHDPILKELNLFISRGELICLLGKNGSGKSTLLRTIAGLLKPLQGQIRWNDKEIPQMLHKERSRIIAFVPPGGLPAPGSLTIREVVSMGRMPYTNVFGRLEQKDRHVIDRYLEQTELSHLQNRFFDRVSDGEKQRAIVCRALVQETPVILMDEPTAHLDISHRINLLSRLQQMAHGEGKSILISTHDLHLAMQFSDKLWIISGARVEEGAAEDLILKGSVAETFLEEGLVFDDRTASFRKPCSAQLPVQLKCPDARVAHWTRYAMEKAGCTPRSSKAGIEVLAKQQSGHWIWVLKKAGRSVTLDSIYELSLHLRDSKF